VLRLECLTGPSPYRIDKKVVGVFVIFRAPLRDYELIFLRN
jgi:hypothetical protein